MRIYADILKWYFTRNASFRSLTIGRGYTFTAHEVSIQMPYDAVEIDPEITRVDKHWNAPNTRIRSFNDDGRWFVMNRKKIRYYFIDAYNDLSIPYH
jgi:hypothetical protein